MDDLISRAAAIAEVEEWVEHGYEVLHWTGIKAMLETQPAVDAVPVVRCRDCKYWWSVNELCTHKRHVNGNVCCHECNAEDYCSDGERRDSE